MAWCKTAVSPVHLALDIQQSYTRPPMDVRFQKDMLSVYEMICEDLIIYVLIWG